jgi:hypothetical protein
MATYSTIPAEAPLVQTAQGRSVKALVAGAAAASFVLGAVAATAVTANTMTTLNKSTKYEHTGDYSPLYTFKDMGVMTFDECKTKCAAEPKEAKGTQFLDIPCITSFDINDQLRAHLHQEDKAFAWVGHKSDGKEGRWVEPKCEKRQEEQYKKDFVNRNDGAFSTNFDDAPGCAVLSNELVEAGAQATGLSGPAQNTLSNGKVNPEIQKKNWIKDTTCDGSAETGGVNCYCQYIKDNTV